MANAIMVNRKAQLQGYAAWVGDFIKQNRDQAGRI